ncbi:hypothetical protein BAUCODRAFT_40694, partial [Baudoinia panamericana UAMH 10762]
NAPKTAHLSPRWLSDVKQRIGRCITFGLDPQQTDKAGRILKQLALDWRELVAGSEGFLTDPQRRGLFRQEVVWGEMDSMGHVNNVMYVRYAESGRVQWGRKLGMHIDPANKKAWSELMTPSGTGLILKAITTEYKFPMKYPDRVSVYHKLRSMPDDGQESFILDVLIMSDLQQRPAARCIEDIVIYDYRIGKKTPLPPWMLAVFRDTFRLQEEAKATNSQRVGTLLEEVRRLETETWDTDNA